MLERGIIWYLLKSEGNQFCQQGRHHNRIKASLSHKKSTYSSDTQISWGRVSSYFKLSNEAGKLSGRTLEPKVNKEKQAKGSFRIESFQVNCKTQTFDSSRISQWSIDVDGALLFRIMSRQ